ncbi:hypothetical protein J2X64_000538 [Phycicoccus sp. 3266]|nr:hypothetical protein [Phycicoccus sp. 3266]
MRASVRYTRGQRYGLLRGVPGWWLRDQKVPALRSPMHGGFWVHCSRIADLVARMEAVGAKVTYAEREAA